MFKCLRNEKREDAIRTGAGTLPATQIATAKRRRTVELDQRRCAIGASARMVYFP